MSGITQKELDELLGPEPVILTAGRDLQRRSRSFNLRPRKHSEARMLRLLSALSEFPVVGDAAMIAGVSTSTVKYWYAKSSEGASGDGFDVPLGADDDGSLLYQRFHNAWDDAMDLGMSRVEKATFKRALGFREIQTYQGRVIYKHDPELVMMMDGVESYATYQRDPVTGAPIAESVLKQDPDLMMFLLKTRMKEKYGNQQTIDVNHRGGVLVVGAVAAVAQTIAETQEQIGDYKADAIDVDFEDASDNT